MADLVSAVVGIQAQDPAAAALSIRARSGGLTAADVDAALVGERSLVLTWSLRGTRHYHHRDDVRWIVAPLSPVLGRPGRRQQDLGIAGDTGDKAVAILRRELAWHGPLTRAEVKERLAPLGVDPSGQAAIHVVRRAALEGLVCVVPAEPGRPERYVLVDDWLGDRRAAAPVDPVAELARRHLAAFGPARPEDFGAWSGLGARAARRAWDMIAGDVHEVEGPAGSLWALDARRGAGVDAVRRPVPLRLLGGFDTLLLGHAARDWVVPPDHARAVNAGGGMVKPVVLADGEAVGVWSYRRPGCRVEVVPFRPFTAGERRKLEAEVADVGRFLGAADPLLAREPAP